MLEITGYPVHWDVDYDDQKLRIARGAFDESITQRSPLPIMYQHDDHQLLGVVLECKADKKGLWIRGLIYEKNVFVHIEKGSLRGFSIHYLRTEETNNPQTNQSVVTKGTLTEISLCPCPSGPYFIDSFKYINPPEKDIPTKN